MRGSGLAVHLVVDQKHRVYACITAEDVPFSLGLSLLEEVRSTSLRPFSANLDYSVPRARLTSMDTLYRVHSSREL